MKIYTFGLFFLFNFFTVLTSFGQIIKYDDWEIAKEQAKKHNKSILIILTGGGWCRPCIKMERNVLEQKEFINFAEQNLIILEINLPNSMNIDSKVYKDYKEFGNKYNTYTLPSLILVDINGREKTKITNGQSSLDKVLKKLKEHI